MIPHSKLQEEPIHPGLLQMLTAPAGKIHARRKQLHEVTYEPPGPVHSAHNDSVRAPASPAPAPSSFNSAAHFTPAMSERSLAGTRGAGGRPPPPSLQSGASSDRPSSSRMSPLRAFAHHVGLPAMDGSASARPSGEGFAAYGPGGGTPFSYNQTYRPFSGRSTMSARGGHSRRYQDSWSSLGTVTPPPRPNSTEPVMMSSRRHVSGEEGATPRIASARTASEWSPIKSRASTPPKRASNTPEPDAPSPPAPEVYLRYHFPKMKSEDEARSSATDLRYDYYDAWVDWPVEEAEVNTTAWSKNVQFHRLYYSKRPGVRPLSKSVPVYHGMNVQHLWHAYAATGLTEPMEVVDICEFVHKLRPRSIHDVKPMLILAQSLLKDYVEGKRHLFAKEISIQKELYEAKLLDAQNEIDHLRAQISEDKQKLAQQRFAKNVRETQVKAKAEDILQKETDITAKGSQIEQLSERLERKTQEAERAHKKLVASNKSLAETKSKLLTLQHQHRECQIELDDLKSLLTPELLSHLQHPALGALLSRTAFLEAILHPNFQAAAEAPTFLQALQHAHFVAALQHAPFLEALGNPAFLAALGDPNFLKMLEDQELVSVICSPAFLRALADPAFRAVIVSEAFAKALGEPGFLSIISDPNRLAALADTKVMVAIKQPKLLELLSSKEFLEMLNNATFVRSIGNPDVCNKLCSPPAVEGLIAGVASSLDAQIASLDELMHSMVGLPDLGALQLPGETVEDIERLASSDPLTLAKRWIARHDSNAKLPLAQKLVHAMCRERPELPLLPQPVTMPDVVTWLQEVAPQEFGFPDNFMRVLATGLLEDDMATVLPIAASVAYASADIRSETTQQALEDMQARLAATKNLLSNTTNDTREADEEKVRFNLDKLAREATEMKHLMVSGADALRRGKATVHALCLELAASQADLDAADDALEKTKEFQKFSAITWEGLGDIPGWTGEEAFAIMHIMREYFDDLRNIYRHYALGGSMNGSEMQALSRDCKIPDKNINMGHIDVIFAGCCHSTRASGANNFLRRNEFIEALLRMAVVKWTKTSKKPSECFEKLVVEHLLPFAKQSTTEEFHNLLHRPEVQMIFAEFDHEINLVFKHFAAGDVKTAQAAANRNSINLTEFEMLLKDCGALGGGRLNKGELPRILGNVQSDDDGKEVSFVEFLELLCACSVYYEPNPYMPAAKRLENFFVRTVIEGLCEGGKSKVQGLKPIHPSRWKGGATKLKSQAKTTHFGKLRTSLFTLKMRNAAADFSNAEGIE